MENNFMKQAKQTMQNLTNKAKNGRQNLQNQKNPFKVFNKSIQSAYEQGAPDQKEQQELKQFEQKLTIN
ncbi:hypothetical protein [Piscibacillus salipiscarius]|uniref:hypothetical protein n=1 Tax=Piscibacillus salipiscarius TaxID=299480 RepID=UPI0006D19AC4|nr:hypothetical protein [Piscibacillus salipiscarius]